MKQTTKPTRKEVALFLKEALQPFCQQGIIVHEEFTKPFRQKDGDGIDHVVATDGSGIIYVNARRAGCLVGPFCKVEKPIVHSVIPYIDFNHKLQARTIRRIDMERLLEQMERHKQENESIPVADVMGVMLSTNGLSFIERAMVIFGVGMARLVWYENEMVVVQLYNERMQETVTIMHMGLLPDKNRHTFVMPTYMDDGAADVQISWHRGMQAWADIKAERERQEEAERMARREVYLVEMVKKAYIPVYAKDAEEARLLCNTQYFDPEDDGDDMWIVGNTVPETVDLDYLDVCYETILTRDGAVERDEIYDLERISDEWHAEHDNKDKQ